jgi:hypothetical protein
MFGFMTMRSQSSTQPRRKIRVDKKISLAQQDFAMRRIFKTRVDVGFFEVGKVLEDLLRRHPAGKHFKHMAHRFALRIVGSPPHTSCLIVIRSICMCLFYNQRKPKKKFTDPDFLRGAFSH